MSNPKKIPKILNDEHVALGYLVQKKRNNDCESRIALRLEEYFVGASDKYLVCTHSGVGGGVGGAFCGLLYDFNLLIGREFTALWFSWIYLESLFLSVFRCVHRQDCEVRRTSWVSRLIKGTVACFAAVCSRVIEMIRGMLPRLNPMKKPSPAPSVRRLHARLCQQLILQTNTYGETSPSLEVAFHLAGSRVSFSPLPASILYSHKIEGTGLLIKGSKTSIVWCSNGPLAAIGQIAAEYNSRYAANWDGFIDLALNEGPDPNNLAGFKAQSSGNILFQLLIMLLCMVVSIPALHAVSDQSGIPLVNNGAVLGDNLLERLGAAASKVGYHVEFASVLAQGGGLKMALPGLVLTPVADQHDKTIRLPVVIPLRGSERLSISLHALTCPTDPIPVGASVKIVLRQVLDGKVVAVKTTKLVRAWSTPDLLWIVDHSRNAGELLLEIVPDFSGPLKVTLPQGLLLPAAL